LTLVNRGPGGALLKQLNAVGVQASAFAVVGGTCTPGSTLGEGKSCVAELLFAPSSSGEMSAMVQVASSGTTPPAVTLHGTGLSGAAGTLALSSSALDFDATRVGARSLPGELVLTNGGQGAIDVTRIDLSGAFSIVATTCPQAPHTMLAGASCKLTLMFSPGQAGPSRGVLEVTTNGVPARLEVVLSGNGVEAADLSSGGCSMVSGDSPLDPTLWSLLLLALGALAYRHWTDRSGAPRRRRTGRLQ
jgi:trimeric autotransporter adhesin